MWPGGETRKKHNESVTRRIMSKLVYGKTVFGV